MKYKLVIFDFDGTLANTFPWFLNTLDIVAEKFDLPRIDKSREQELRNLNAHNFLKHLKIPLYKLPAIATFMRSLMTEEIDRIKLFAGAEKVLRSLKARGCKIAIVSTNSRENIGRVMGSDLVELLDHFAGGVSMFGKAAKLKKIIKQSGLSREDAIYIADELRDVEASQKIGLAMGAVAWGYNSVESLLAAKPTEMFYSPEEILEKV